MEEVLTIRVPKGTRKNMERRARAEHLTLSQYIRRALDTEALLGVLEGARAALVPVARAKRSSIARMRIVASSDPLLDGFRATLQRKSTIAQQPRRELETESILERKCCQ